MVLVLLVPRVVVVVTVVVVVICVPSKSQNFLIALFVVAPFAAPHAAVVVFERVFRIVFLFLHFECFLFDRDTYVLLFFPND